MSKPITIGRDPKSSIWISEDYDIVSNDHAEIVQDGVNILFIDHSSNGTIINGQKIRGRSVNIYRGDKIVLAGVYELRWSEIEPLITPVGRPTVARNIRGDIHASTGQATILHDARNSRSTEIFRADEQDGRHGRQVFPHREPRQQPRQTSEYTDERRLSAHAERELSKWNWGAFYFGWIWGVFNKVYVSLLQLVVGVLSFALTVAGLSVITPIFGMISLGISIWLGVKGSRMAWDNGAYSNLEHFRSSRHKWNVAAAVCFGVMLFLIIILLLLFIDIIGRML